MRNLAYLFLFSTLFACQKTPPIGGGVPLISPLPIILAAVGSGAALATLSGDVAQEKGDLAGCITGHSIAAALITAGTGISGNLMGGAFPAVDYDISACLDILEDGAPVGEDVPALVEPIIKALLSGTTTIISAYSGKLKCEESVWALAAIAYTGGILPAVLDEIESPDGAVSFPSVVVNLESCEEE